jgi:hypothetical protein
MDYQPDILNQLKEINQKLQKLPGLGKNMWSNFLLGISKSFGYLFGMIIVTLLIAYIFSRLNISQYINDWIKDNQSTLNYQISRPVLDQP